MVESVDTKDLKSFGHCGCAGSSPAPGTTFLQCGSSSVGRAQPSQGWGRGFEPRFPLNFSLCGFCEFDFFSVIVLSWHLYSRIMLMLNIMFT